MKELTIKYIVTYNKTGKVMEIEEEVDTPEQAEEFFKKWNEAVKGNLK